MTKSESSVTAKVQPWAKWYTPSKENPVPTVTRVIQTLDDGQNGSGPIDVPATEFDI
jgi:hypothetical protein